MRGRTRGLSWTLLLVVAVACSRETPDSRPASIALVLEGHEYIWGNDQYKVAADCKAPAIIASGEPCRIVKVTEGIFATLKATLPAFAAAARPGDDAVVIVYDERPIVRFEGRIDALTASALGAQVDQRDRTGRDLVGAFNVALDRLEQAPPGPRRLIAVTDGQVTSTDLATTARMLAALALRVREADVDVTILLLDYFPIPIVMPDGWTAHQRALAALGHVVRIDDPAELRTALPAAGTP